MTKRVNHLIFQILLLVYVLTGCNSSEEYAYIEGFSNYTKRFCNEDVSQIDDRCYYITSLNGCKPCVLSSLEGLLENPSPNVTLIIIGKAIDEQTQSLYSQIT